MHPRRSRAAQSRIGLVKACVLPAILAGLALPLGFGAPAAASNPSGTLTAVPTPDPRSSSQAATFVDATQAASSDGSVRLIVSLKVAFAPEPNLDAVQLGNQQRNVEAAQKAVSNQLVASTGIRIDYTYHAVPALLITTDASGVAALESSPLVASVEMDIPEKSMLAESVPLIGGDSAQQMGYDGSGWNVAILDTGVDSSHPFLAGKVVSEDCFSLNSFCPNGLKTQTGPGAAAPCTYLPGSCSHGTHVAGIAAGKGATFNGVAPGAGIVAIQIFTKVSGGFCGSNPAASPCNLTMPSDQLKGLERVYELRNTFRISSVNMSIGGLTHTGSCDSSGPARAAAAANLKAVGIALVAAAGNESANGVDDPGCYSSTVSVASTTKADVISGFSNNASNVSLLAPGSGINSSIPGGGFGYKSGTSMATPHVTGAWAVMKQQDPTASVDTILGKLQSTGTPIVDNRFATPITKPRINLFLALGSPTTTAGGRYTPVVPTRIVDTRSGLGMTVGPVGVGDVRSFSLPAGLVPVEATSVALNLTATDASIPAAITVYPGGASQPVTTSLTVQPGFAAANLVIVPLGPGQQLQVVHSGLELQLIVDVEGYYAASGQTWIDATPTRLVDSRIGLGTTGTAFGADETRTLAVPDSSRPFGTTVAALNVTVTDSTAHGFATVYKAGTPRPVTSSLNPAPYHTLPNLVFVELDATGQFDFYNAAASTHVVIDLVGTFSAYGGVAIVPTTPSRIFDSRSGPPGTPNFTTGTVVLIPTSTVPLGASAVIAHLVAFDATAATFLYPHTPYAPPGPPTSMLNVVPGDMTSNLAIIPVTKWLGSGPPYATFVITNQTGMLNVVVDVVGYIP